MTICTRRTFLGANAALILTPFKAFASDSAWNEAAPIPIKTQELYPIVHKGRLYVAGGIATKLGVPYFSSECFSYDPGQNEWRQEADLPEALHHAALVSSGERLFLVGGFNGGYTHVWRMRSKVYELVDSAWVEIGDLPQPQAEGVLALAPNGKIHFVTGQSPRGDANAKRSDHREVTTHLSWEPGSSEWAQEAHIPTPRNSATGGWVGDQLVVTGGRTSAGNLDDTEIYDLSNGEWRRGAPLPLPQAGTASVVLDKGLLVFGGEIFVPKSDVFKEVWYYELAADKWHAMPPMRTPRHGIGAGRFGDQVFVIGGATEPGGSGTSDLNEMLDLTNTTLP